MRRKGGGSEPCECVDCLVWANGSHGFAHCRLSAIERSALSGCLVLYVVLPLVNSERILTHIFQRSSVHGPCYFQIFYRCESKGGVEQVMLITFSRSSTPETQRLIWNIYISRTLPRIPFQQLPNLAQFFRRQLHSSSLPVFQCTPYVPAVHRSSLDNQQRDGCNSRRSGKGDDVVAKRSNPSNAQLGDGDVLPICDGRHCFYESQVMIDILGPALSNKKSQTAKENLHYPGNG